MIRQKSFCGSPGGIWYPSAASAANEIPVRAEKFCIAALVTSWLMMYESRTVAVSAVNKDHKSLGEGRDFDIIAMAPVTSLYTDRVFCAIRRTALDRFSFTALISWSRVKTTPCTTSLFITSR